MEDMNNISTTITSAKSCDNNTNTNTNTVSVIFATSSASSVISTASSSSPSPTFAITSQSSSSSTSFPIIPATTSSSSLSSLRRESPAISITPPLSPPASSSCSSSSSSPTRPTTSNNHNTGPSTSTSSSVPGSSFLLSTLLNLKPNPNKTLTEEFSKTVNMKSKTLNSDDGGDESDSGVKITYEQLSSKPPRKRLCYSYHQSKVNSSNTNIAVNNSIDSINNVKTGIPIISKTTTSDEENKDQQQQQPQRKSPGTSPQHHQQQQKNNEPSPVFNNTTSKNSSNINSASDQFPILIRTDEFRRRGIKGSNPGRVERYLVASRDIEPGEIILKENPLIAGPISRKTKTLDKSKYCLGCYQHVNGLYKCSKCGWPVCNAKCEKV